VKRKTAIIIFLVVFIINLISACSNPSVSTTVGFTTPFTTENPKLAPQYSYRVINSFPHDPAAFTQGLVIDEGYLYESTGKNGKSSLRKVELTSGKILNQYNLPDEYFGEGMTIFQEKIIQLTWKSKTGFVYSREDFTPLQQFSYSTEGWGMTHDNSRLIMSDGTANLFFLNPDTFELTGSILIQDGDTPVIRLNELEYINGKIFANIWLTDTIAIIDPQKGKVVSWIDLTGILQVEPGVKTDVLNGIAYDEIQNRLFITGKFWPTLFEIELVPKTD
jgi:glutaminyl-peptide cyclotransferase